MTIGNFWRNTDDRDVKKFLNYFTEIETSKIDQIVNNSKNINELKILLANEATKILHGKPAAEKAEKTAKETFKFGGAGKDLPEIKIRENEIKHGVKILDFLSSSKIMLSKSDARRAIKSNALKLDNVLMDDDTKILELSDFKNGKSLKISFGKKKTLLN